MPPSWGRSQATVGRKDPWSAGPPDPDTARHSACLGKRYGCLKFNPVFCSAARAMTWGAPSPPSSPRASGSSLE